MHELVCCDKTLCVLPHQMGRMPRKSIATSQWRPKLPLSLALAAQAADTETFHYTTAMQQPDSDQRDQRLDESRSLGVRAS